MAGKQLDFSDYQLTTAKKQTKREAERRDVGGIASGYRRAANQRSMRVSLGTSPQAGSAFCRSSESATKLSPQGEPCHKLSGFTLGGTGTAGT